MTTDGKNFRLRRLSVAGDGKYLFVPLDHSVSDGPVVRRSGWDGLIRSIVTGGADAVIVHKGRARTIAPDVLGRCSLIVHLSAGTTHASDANAKVLVGEVEEAVRLGADAVSVHVNIGSDTESQQLADLGAVAKACDAWGMPLLAMIYPRGPRIQDPHDAKLLSHVVNIAVDLGADLVKTTSANPVDRMAEVVESCPIPIVCAGGPADGSNLVSYGASLMLAGCAGLAIGRRIFTSPQPAPLVARLAAVVHASQAETTEPRSTLKTGAA